MEVQWEIGCVGCAFDGAFPVLDIECPVHGDIARALVEEIRSGARPAIEATPPAQCELCGKHDELRPYGPNGENICFDCGRKDPTTTERQMARRLRADRN